MGDLAINFPVYRKYKGIGVWFKILNDRKFIEIKQIGSKFKEETVDALQYPEMVLIQDMIACFEGRWEVIQPEDYEAVAARISGI